MIDFHTHVLPGIDDGAKDTDTAVAMLQESILQGVTTIVCTPHYYGKQRSPQSFIERRQAAYKRLQAKLPEGISLRLGAEVYFTEDVSVAYEDLALLAIEDTPYILLELPFTKQYRERLFEKIDEFMAETGLTPIIAHVDRYPAVLAKPSIATRLVEMGCLLQVNAEAFEAKGVKSFAACLLQKGMIHAIGSDMHNTEARPQCMKKYVAAIERLEMKPMAKKIADLSEGILRGDEIRVSPKKVGKIFGKYF